MQKKDIWKFALIFFILVLASFIIWFIYDKNQNMGPIKRSELSSLDETYFKGRVGRGFLFYVMGKDTLDLQSDVGIKTVLPLLYLREEPVSVKDFEAYMKENFGLSNYKLETGEYKMVNDMKYTVTKKNDMYTTYLGGFDALGVNYKYKDKSISNNEAIVTYELEVDLDLPSPGTIIMGKYDVYFKYDNGYLLYDKITYTEYDNPKKIVDLEDQYVIDYLEETVKIFTEKTYESFNNDDIAIDTMRSLTDGGGDEHALLLDTMENYGRIKFGKQDFTFDKNRYTDKFGTNYDFTLNYEDGDIKRYYVSEFSQANKEYFNRFDSKELLSDNTYVVNYKYGKLNNDNTYTDKGITKVYMEYNYQSNVRNEFTILKIIYEEI